LIPIAPLEVEKIDFPIIRFDQKTSDTTLYLTPKTTKNLMNNTLFPSKDKMNRHLQGIVEIHPYLFLDIFH